MVAFAWGWVVFGILFFIFMVTAIIGVGALLWRLRWNYTWVLLEEQPNGKSQITKKGRARLMAFGDGGEEIFFLRGLKKWRVAYGKRISNNGRQIAWEVGQDGYWYNIDFAGLDKKLREVGVHPVHMDMRYAYSSVRRGIENNYGQKTFMDKYGTIITFGLLGLCIIALGISQWWAFHELNKGATTSANNLKVQEAIVDKYSALLDKIGGTATPATGTGFRTVTPV